VGATVKCGGGVKRAALSDPFGRKSSTHRLNHSGCAPELPGTVRITPGRGKVCTAVDASAKIRTDHHDSDNIGATSQVRASGAPGRAAAREAGRGPISERSVWDLR
jgi:hypothetical protein